MMTPIIYLHVGPHKTGSTYLQYCFSKQYHSLRKQGIEYPTAGREFSKNGHHNLAWYFTQRPPINTTPKELLRQISILAEKNQNYLFSSEEFSNLKEEALKKLKDSFPNHSFHVLFFLRKGGKLIISLWREIIKGGTTLPLNKMSQDFWLKHGGYNPFTPEENIARFEKNLSSKITILNYENLLKSHVDLTVPFSEALNINIIAERKKLNESTSIEVTEFIRAANLYTESLGKFLYGYPRIICFRMLRIPILKQILTRNIRGHFNKLHKTLSPKEFIDLGYNETDLENFNLENYSQYIPENQMLIALNQDNILPWRIIKRLLQNK